MPLGERVKQLRKERGWSQDDLGQKVGTAAHQISRYENGHITPSTEMIVKLAECFDVSLDYLLIEGLTRRPLAPATTASSTASGDLSQLSDEDRDTSYGSSTRCWPRTRSESSPPASASSIPHEHEISVRPFRAFLRQFDDAVHHFLLAVAASSFA